MNKIRVGVIGCGSIAKFRHLPEYAANEISEIAAVCDLVEERAKKMAERYGGEVYTDYEEIIARNDIDAVVQTSLLPGKDINLSVSIDGDDITGFLKIPFVGKVKLKDGHRIA